MNVVVRRTDNRIDAGVLKRQAADAEERLAARKDPRQRDMFKPEPASNTAVGHLILEAS